MIRDINGRLHLFWRLLLFILALTCLVAPLLVLRNALLQFLFGAVLLIGLLWVWGRWIDRASLSNYGLALNARIAVDFIAGIAIGIIAIAALFAIGVQSGMVDSFAMRPGAINREFWLFLAKTLLVGFWEESLFRGFLIYNLRNGLASRLGDRKAVTVAVALSSLLFGLAHAGTSNFSLAAFAVLSFNGVVLALPFVWTGRLGLSIGMHAAWNFAQTKLFGFTMSGNATHGSLLAGDWSGPDVWTGGAYGPEAGFSGVIGLGIMLLLAFVIARPQAR